MQKIQPIFRCLQTTFIAIFVLGLMAAALNPQPEPIVLGGMSSAANLTNGGALFSGQTLAMEILHRPCTNCLNTQSELPNSTFLINASMSGRIFSGQIQTVRINSMSTINHTVDIGSVPK